MTKVLFLLRHGKARQDGPSGDKARALTEGGKRDSAAIGRLLGSLGGVLDIVVCSDARRARETALIVASEVGFEGEVSVEPLIYGAEMSGLLEVVRGLPDAAQRALLVGHNPGFEELANALCVSGTRPVHLPTTGLVQIELSAERWSSICLTFGKLIELYTP